MDSTPYGTDRPKSAAFDLPVVMLWRADVVGTAHVELVAQQNRLASVPQARFGMAPNAHLGTAPAARVGKAAAIKTALARPPRGAPC